VRGAELGRVRLIRKRSSGPGTSIPLLQRALAIDEKSLGPDHPSVATALDNLAALYRNQDRLADAEPLFKRSLDNL